MPKMFSPDFDPLRDLAQLAENISEIATATNILINNERKRDRAINRISSDIEKLNLRLAQLERQFYEINPVAKPRSPRS